MVRLNGDQMREKLEKLVKKTVRREIHKREKETGSKVNGKVS